MTQHPYRQKPKLCVYDQLQDLSGVVGVELFDFAEKGVGVFVIGGSNEDIANSIGMHIYIWNRDWFVGDTVAEKEFFTAKWFRNYENSQKLVRKMKNRDGVIEEITSLAA